MYEDSQPTPAKPARLFTKSRRFRLLMTNSPDTSAWVRDRIRRNSPCLLLVSPPPILQDHLGTSSTHLPAAVPHVESLVSLHYRLVAGTPPLQHRMECIRLLVIHMALKCW